MIGKIMLLVFGGGAVLFVTRYVANFFIQGTTFSTNVTSGNITDISGHVVAFTGLLAGNNTIKYVIPFAIVIAILIAIFMAVKKSRKQP